MDLADWVDEAESLLRLDGLWPEQHEERARGVLEDHGMCPVLTGVGSMMVRSAIECDAEPHARAAAPATDERPCATGLAAARKAKNRFEMTHLRRLSVEVGLGGGGIAWMARAGRRAKGF